MVPANNSVQGGCITSSPQSFVESGFAMNIVFVRVKTRGVTYCLFVYLTAKELVEGLTLNRRKKKVKINNISKT